MNFELAEDPNAQMRLNSIKVSTPEDEQHDPYEVDVDPFDDNNTQDSSVL